MFFTMLKELVLAIIEQFVTLFLNIFSRYQMKEQEWSTKNLYYSQQSPQQAVC